MVTGSVGKVRMLIPRGFIAKWVGVRTDKKGSIVSVVPETMLLEMLADLGFVPNTYNKAKNGRKPVVKTAVVVPKPMDEPLKKAAKLIHRARKTFVPPDEAVKPKRAYKKRAPKLVDTPLPLAKE